MPGSHKCGRLEHGPIGGQQGANLERIELLKQKFPIIPVEMDAGTVIYFCLLKHRKKIVGSEADKKYIRKSCRYGADTWLQLFIHLAKVQRSHVPHYGKHNFARSFIHRSSNQTTVQAIQYILLYCGKDFCNLFQEIQ